MESIYKRKRIKLPKIIFQNFNTSKSKKVKKITKFLIIVLAMVITFKTIINSVEPILDTLAKDKAKSVATIICNEETTNIMKNYQYDDLITIYRDNDNNITMIQSNIIPINNIISEAGEKIQKRIDETNGEKVYINLGSFTGSKLLSGMGPSIAIKLSLVGNIETTIASEFIAQGINQTIHRIYLQIDCSIKILTPYNILEDKIINQVLIAENIIVGKIPSSYYNLEGMSTENAADIVE
jgi:sporulation protein YunB